MVTSDKVATEQQVEPQSDTSPGEQENILQQMLRDAKSASEPGAGIGEVHHTETAELPLTMITHSVSSAGYVDVWDNKTGEHSVVNRNMLPKQLQKKRADGSLIFTIYKPAIEPLQGTHKCLLHPESANRDRSDALGLATCKKHNLRNPFEVERHMRSRHKIEWETLERERVTRERDEDRAFQRQMLTMAQGNVQDNTQALTESTDVAVQSPHQVSKDIYPETCPECQQEFVAASLKQAQNKVRLHRRTHTRSKLNDGANTASQEA